jgi:hypothetical protein
MIPFCLVIIICVYLLVLGFMQWVPLPANIKQLIAGAVWVILIVWVVVVCWLMVPVVIGKG